MQQIIRRRALPVKPYGPARSLAAERTPWRWIQALAVAAALAGGFLWQGTISEQSAAETPIRPVADFRIVPVRVHLLRAPEAPAVGTTLTKEDVARIFRKANGIWHAAGIHLWPESIVEEPPAVIDDPHKVSLMSEAELRPLRPKDSRAEGMFHLYFVGRMGVNGIYLGREAVFVQQAAELRVVEGGIDEPLPRVTSHEIGHGLGLSHRQARTNLMASGTTGTSLNQMEIDTARETCGSLTWVLGAADFIDSAEKLLKAGQREAAFSRFRAVADLPGASPLKDRASRALQEQQKAAERLR